MLKVYIVILFCIRLIAEEMIRVHAIRPAGREVVTALWDKLYTFLDLSADGFEDPEKNKQ